MPWRLVPLQDPSIPKIQRFQTYDAIRATSLLTLKTLLLALRRVASRLYIEHSHRHKNWSGIAFTLLCQKRNTPDPPRETRPKHARDLDTALDMGSFVRNSYPARQLHPLAHSRVNDRMQATALSPTMAVALYDQARRQMERRVPKEFANVIRSSERKKMVIA